MSARAIRSTLGLGLALGVAALAAACPAAKEEVVHKTAIDQGKALFSDPKVSGTTINQMSCSTCHELHAGDQEKLLPGAPLVGVLERPTYWGGSVDTLLGSINACLYYFMLANDPWTGEEPEAQAIYAYLESLEPTATDVEKSPQPFTIGPVSAPTTGNTTHGASLYREACATCHGARSSGAGKLVSIAPTLPEQTLKAHPAPTYTDTDRRLIFIEKTRHGGFLGYGGQMPPVSEESLSEQDVGDLLAYLGVPTGQ